MKKKHYQIGKYKGYAYFKPVGQGYELGFYLGGKTLFVGNFVYLNEAKKYWGILNRDVRQFYKRYWVTSYAPFAWYTKFFTNYMYNTYYKYLDVNFSKYTRNYTKAVKRDCNKYMKLRRNWTPADKMHYRQAA